MRVGQKAEIVADIYPGYTYKGHVDSISMGTGAAFSLLPPENATGNWVKVVQRVPVKIVIDGHVARRQTAAPGAVGRSRDRSQRSQRPVALIDRAAALPQRRPDGAQREAATSEQERREPDATVASRSRRTSSQDVLTRTDSAVRLAADPVDRCIRSEPSSARLPPDTRVRSIARDASLYYAAIRADSLPAPSDARPADIEQRLADLSRRAALRA